MKGQGWAYIFWAVLALSLAAPSASAIGFPSEHVLQYRAFVHTEQSSDGILAETPVTVPLVHSWISQSGTSILEVRVSLVTQPGAAVNPTADYQVLWDGTPIVDCTWRIEGGTITGGRFNPHISLFCQIPDFVTPGPHTIEVQRTAVTGTPVTNAVTSIILHQTETVTNMTQFETLTGFTGIEFMVLLGLCIVGIILWSRSRDHVVQSFGAVLPMIAGVLMLVVVVEAGLAQLWVGAVGIAAILFLLGVYLFIRSAVDGLSE